MSYTPHSSYYGIGKVIYPEDIGVNKHINEAIKDLILFYEKNNNETNQKGLKIFDSFFSDTITDNVCRDLFTYCIENNFQIEIVLFDPFSNLSKERKKILTQYNRFTGGLNKIYWSLFKKRIPNYANLISLNSEYVYFKDWFLIFEEIRAHKNITLKYVNTLSEVPVYIFGDFALKGHLFLRQSAAEMPWVLALNDKTKVENLYSYLLDNFNNLIKDSYEFLEFDRHIFISYDHNLLAAHAIESICQNNGFIPVHYKTENKNIKHHSDNICQLIKACDNSIFLFTQTDNIRPNVKREFETRFNILKNSENNPKGKNIMVVESKLDFENTFGTNDPRSEFERYFLILECDDKNKFPEMLKNELTNE